MESLTSGTLAGTGSFRCEECGYVVTLAAADALPECPSCASQNFARASLFSGPRFARGGPPSQSPEEREAWLGRGARRRSTEPGQYLVFERDGDTRVDRARSASGRAWAAAWPPTCASTTRPCRAGTRSSSARPTASASWTTGR